MTQRVIQKRKKEGKWKRGGKKEKEKKGEEEKVGTEWTMDENLGATVNNSVGSLKENEGQV